MNTVEIQGKEYPILFDFNVFEQIQKRYGNVQDLLPKLSDYGEIKWVLALLIQEARDFEAEERNQPYPPPITPEWLGRRMSVADTLDTRLAQAILDAFYSGMTNEQKNFLAGETEKALKTGSMNLKETAENPSVLPG